MPEEPQSPSPWIDAVLRLGFPAAVALYLIYILTQSLSGDIRTVHAAVDDLKSNARIQTLILKQICLNGAKDDAARSRCDVR